MVKENRESRQNGRRKKKSGTSSTKDTSAFVRCDIKDPKLLSKWKPINPTLIAMLQRLQNSHAVPIFIDKNPVAAEASFMIRSHQTRVIEQCQNAIAPNMKHNFSSLRKDIKAADEKLEFLRSKVELLDSQIAREQKKLTKLKDAIEVVS